MPAKGCHNLQDPKAAEAALRDYRNGADLKTVAVAYRVRIETLRRVLVAAGEHVRTKSEQISIGVTRAKGSVLREMSRDRLWELYWSPQSRYPSLTTLARQLGVSTSHLKEVMDSHGFETRTRAEQLKVDGRLGRRGHCNNYRFQDLDPTRQAEVREKLAAAQRGKRHSAARRRRNGLAHRKSVTRPCAWCGNPVTRVPTLMNRTVPERTYCNVTCSNRAGWWRRKQGDAAPRPLILTRLQEATAHGRRDYATLERAGRSFGARDPEIMACAGF